MKDDWEKAKKIFSAATKLTPAERLRFLDGICADDAETRREVESLLESLDNAESFMESSAAKEVGVLGVCLVNDTLMKINFVSSRQWQSFDRYFYSQGF